MPLGTHPSTSAPEHANESPDSQPPDQCPGQAATCTLPDSHDPKRRPAPKRYFDGGGLILQVTTTGSKVWVQRLTIDGTRHDYGLGSWPGVSLVKAREVARRNAAAIQEYHWATLRGESPRLPEIEALRRAADARCNGRFVHAAIATGGMTFAEAHEARITERARHWKNPGTDLHSWRADLKTRLKDIAALTVAGVDVFHLRRALEPLTLASRDKLLRRYSAVLEWAIAGKLRPDNPARALRKTWAGLKREEVKHRATMPWAEVPAFYAKLTARGVGPDARGALALAVLTGVRSGEARGARWEEVHGLDSDSPVWVIPAARMKDGREHRVPLSPQAVEVLRAAGPKDEGRVFRAPRGGAVSDKALRQVMADLGAGAYTIHGFRTSARTYWLDRGVAPDLCEECLSHSYGSTVARAYARSSMVDRRRRECMDPWGGYVAGGTR